MKVCGITYEENKVGLVAVCRVERNSYVIAYMDHEEETCEFMRVCTNYELWYYDTDIKEQRDNFYNGPWDYFCNNADMGWMSLCVSNDGDLQVLVLDSDWFEDHGVLMNPKFWTPVSVEYVAKSPEMLHDIHAKELYKKLKTLTSNLGWARVAESWMADIKKEKEEEELEEQYV